MDDNRLTRRRRASAGTEDARPGDETGRKRTFESPKLKYVSPELMHHGSVTKITAGFFGPFYPP